MEIQTVTKYRFNGTEYTSLDKIKTEIENKIGAIIDYADVTLTPKQKLNLLDAIVKNKTELVKLLTVQYDNSYMDLPLQSDTKNILDF